MNIAAPGLSARVGGARGTFVGSLGEVASGVTLEGDSSWRGRIEGRLETSSLKLGRVGNVQKAGSSLGEVASGVTLEGDSSWRGRIEGRLETSSLKLGRVGNDSWSGVYGSLSCEDIFYNMRAGLCLW
ncbi:MAG: hypothetical protein LQ345_002818 [Seirophora villosa]|nr:MAG: hypothetical protein LQ345_002818 [Seirophora villosa]